MKSFFQYLIVIFTVLLLVSSNSFSTESHPEGSGSSDNSESDEEREDREWEENFEDKFEEDPQEGFNRDSERAWSTINDNPEILTNNPQMASSAAKNNPNNFVDTIKTSSEDLLSDEAVFNEYRNIMGGNVDVVNENLESLGKYLEEVGISSPQAHEYILKNYDQERQVFTLETQDGSIISISESDLRGGSVNSDGTVNAPSGQRILEGNVISQQGGELQVSSSTLNQPARVENQEIVFTGDRFNLGADMRTSNQFVRAIDEVSFIDYLGRDAFLTPQTRLSVNQEGDYGLQGRVETRSLRNQGTVHEFMSVDTAYETDFPSGSNEEMILSSRASCCEGLSNYIIEQTTADGSTLMNVKVQGQGNPKIEILSTKQTSIQTDLITDETRLSIVKADIESAVQQFDITREGVEQIGFGEAQNGLTLLAVNSKQFHSGQGEELFVTLYQDGEFVRSNQIMMGESAINLNNFPQEIREQLQNAQFSSIPQNEQSIVSALNRLGLPSDFGFRSELAEQLGIEGYRGTASQNEQMINMLREGELNTGSSFYFAGEQFPEGFELDPQFIGFVPNQAQINENWAPSGCSVSGGYDCQIGAFRYQLLDDGTYLARDGERFDRNGALLNQNGQFVNRQGEACNQACAFSSQQDFFEGGSQEQQARGNLNAPIPRVSTSGYLDIGSITVRGASSINNNFIPPENLPANVRVHFPQGTTAEDLLIRTIISETRGYSDDAMEGVAAVMLNRAINTGMPPERVVLRRGAFSGWNPGTGYVTNQGINRVYRDMVNEPVTSAEYQRAQAALQRATQRDITGGATHFYNPRVVTPSWARYEVETARDNAHKFVYLTQGDMWR